MGKSVQKVSLKLMIYFSNYDELKNQQISREKYNIILFRGKAHIVI